MNPEAADILKPAAGTTMPSHQPASIDGRDASTRAHLEVRCAPAAAMFSLLADKLQDVFKDLRGQGKITETNITDALREVRMALLEADVEFSVSPRVSSRG